jgi:hypothetical protein
MVYIVLGVFLATSESQDADVECFSAEDVSQQTTVLALDPEVASCESFLPQFSHLARQTSPPSVLWL